MIEIRCLDFIDKNGKVIASLNNFDIPDCFFYNFIEEIIKNSLQDFIGISCTYNDGKQFILRYKPKI